MEESSYAEYNILAQLAISLDNDWDYKKTYELVETKVIKAGTHAYATMNEEITNNLKYMEEKYKVHWYRSADTIVSENPYYNWLSKGSTQQSKLKKQGQMLFDTVKSLFHFKTWYLIELNHVVKLELSRMF